MVEFSFGELLPLQKMSILCVAGSKGCGKDTLCDYLVEHHGFTKFAFADALKEVSLHLIRATWPSLSHLTLDDMYDREAKEKIYPDILFAGRPFSIRWYLQYVGTEVIRNHLDKDIWVRTVIGKIQRLLEKDPEARVCISDCRFDNEVRCIKQAFGSTRVQALRLTRTTESSPTEAKVHASEVQDFEVDATFANDGPKDALFAFSKSYAST